MKKFISILCYAALLCGCVYPFEVESVEVDRILVLDGSIINGGMSYFTASYVSPLDKEYYEPADGTIVLVDEKQRAIKATRLEAGKFEVNTTNLAKNRSYKLVFSDTQTGKKYSSTYAMPVTKPTAAELFYTMDDEWVYIYAKTNLGTDTGYVRTDYSQVWEYKAYYPISCVYDPESASITSLMIPDNSLLFCWNASDPAESHVASNEGKEFKVIHNAPVTKIKRSDLRLSSLYRIDATIYSISRNHFKYLETLEKINSINGDLFAPTPSEPRGNIFCDQDPDEFVIGYIGMMSSIEAQLYINSSKVYIPVYMDQFLFLPEDEAEFPDLYEKGYLPIKYAPNMEDGFLWGPARCVDCTLMGGSKEKPEGWPSSNN